MTRTLTEKEKRRKFTSMIPAEHRYAFTQWIDEKNTAMMMQAAMNVAIIAELITYPPLVIKPPDLDEEEAEALRETIRKLKTCENVYFEPPRTYFTEKNPTETRTRRPHADVPPPHVCIRTDGGVCSCAKEPEPEPQE